MNKIFKNLVFVVLFVMVSILGIANVNAQNKDIEVTNIKVKEKSGTITVDTSIPAGTYTYVVTATDNELEISEDATFTINVAKKTPTLSISPTSATITILQAAGTNYSASSNVTFGLTINSCESWHYIGSHTTPTTCSNDCYYRCIEEVGTTIWDWGCSSSNVNGSTPTGSGRYCHCKY